MVYPNPTKGNVFVDLNQFEGINMNIQLINNLGQVVENRFVSNSKSIVALDVSNNSKGIYYLKLQSDNHSKTYKMIIE